MLISIRVKNFKSFEDETVLTMIASTKERDFEKHIKEIMSSTRVLKYAVIYGANASGKSNLIEVFQFIQHCLSESIPAESINLFCKNKEENKNLPSEFELIFSIGKEIYAYGFSVVLSSLTIKREYLYRLYQNGKNKELFSWNFGEKPCIGETLSLTKDEKTRLAIYVDDFEEEGSRLFLSVLNDGKRYKESSISFLKDTFHCITKQIKVCTPYSSLSNLDYYNNNVSLSKISEIIQSFDTGISSIVLKQSSMEEISKEVPQKLFSRIMQTTKKVIESRGLKVPQIIASLRSDKAFYNISVDEANEISVTSLRITHGSSFYDFEYGEESDGTKRLFDLVDMLIDNSPDSIYVIDEMERSLHPKLTEHFIELFSKAHSDDNVQLLFTTHEASILDQNLFRRDEIWFVERDKYNKSHVYSLDKFKERYDKKLSKSYLEGRYGAIPVFSEFSFEGD